MVIPITITIFTGDDFKRVLETLLIKKLSWFIVDLVLIRKLIVSINKGNLCIVI